MGLSLSLSNIEDIAFNRNNNFLGLAKNNISSKYRQKKGKAYGEEVSKGAWLSSVS